MLFRSARCLFLSDTSGLWRKVVLAREQRCLTVHELLSRKILKEVKKYFHKSSSRGWWQSWRKVPVAFQMQENFTKFRNFLGLWLCNNLGVQWLGQFKGVISLICVLCNNFRRSERVIRLICLLYIGRDQSACCIV